MSRDFTIDILRKLINELKNKGYNFVQFKDYFNCNKEKIIIFRHDVDKLPENSLMFAKIQNEIGISGTYYFRIAKDSFNTKIIKKIAELGHEIGYHYEDLTLARGNNEEAYKLFVKNLNELRKYYPVKTICMHGNPLSKWDNKDIWQKYSYKESGIIAEPYFDLDFNNVFYITDTGRRWDGGKVSIRDKVKSNYKNKYKTTNDIIRAIKDDKFPSHTMFTFHPQRWSDRVISWSSELVRQKTKNVLKRIIISKSKWIIK
jgi:hypothetical protein